MKRELLKPSSWLYTQRMNDIGSDEEIAEIKRRRAQGGYRECPIVVIPSESEGKFAIVAGNHRALLASWENESLEAFVIENDEDFAAVEQQLPFDSPEGQNIDDASRYVAARNLILEAAKRLANKG